MFLAVAAVLAALAAGIRPFDPPAKPGSMAPNLTAVGDTILMSWLEPLTPGAQPGEGEMALRYASFDGRKWSEPRTVVSSGKIFANWADFPAIAPSRGGWLLAAWPEMSDSGTYDYFMELARIETTGGPWRRLGPVHEDRTPTEHGFISFVPEGDSIRAFWLDGREMKGDSGSMSLRTALVREAPGRSVLLDSRVCECCQTSAAATAQGPIVVYRDRSDTERRDISIVRLAGGKWTAPRPVATDDWNISGCPVNGPAVAASGRAVAVAWFTVAQEKPRVQLAFSADAGASFAKPLVIDDAGPAGRVDVSLDANGDAIVGWVGAEGNNASIRLRRVSPGGRIGPPVTVAPTSIGRTSGFPRIERLGATLLVAWVEASEPFRLHAAVLPLSAVPAPGAAAK